MSIHVLTWNVNGLRSCLRKKYEGFIQFFNTQNIQKYDVLCFQEQKCDLNTLLDDNGILKELKEYPYIAHTSESLKKGYAGACTFSKIPFEFVKIGLGIEKHDMNGRIVTIKLKNIDMVVINVYVPNSGENLKNIEYRQTWDKDFMNHIKNMEKKFKKSTIIICGDLNAAVNEDDVYNPKKFKNKAAGFTDIERNFIKELTNEHGYLDIFKSKYPKVKTNEHFTFWSNRGGNRARNLGWRIDYFFSKQSSENKIKWQDIKVLQDVLGSDHCPVVCNFALE
jgi:exodeoxyribonuclease-3